MIVRSKPRTNERFFLTSFSGEFYSFAKTTGRDSQRKLGPGAKSALGGP